MADRKSFNLYKSWKPMIDGLCTQKPEQGAALFMAIFAYQEDGTEPGSDADIYPIWCLIKAKFDEDSAAYAAKCEKNREIASERERTKTNVHERERTYTNVHEREPDTDNDTETDTDTGNEKVLGKRASAFTPPTVAEVQDYCRERGNNVDPERFVDFYASKGWYIGKNKMKDWRAAVRTWEKERAPTARSGTTQIDEWAAALREVDG